MKVKLNITLGSLVWGYIGYLLLAGAVNAILAPEPNAKEVKTEE